MAKETNNHFGRYRVLGTLGGGASGKLYLTVDPAGEYATLLTFHSHLAADVRLRAALLDAAHLASPLRHPNVATTYESGETEGRTFVTTEYVPGESLATILGVLARTPEPVPAPIAATVARGIATGLAYVHSATDGRNAPLRLLHRDLRPANVFVTFDGVVKLAGMGISAALVTSADWRSTARGGFAYASPEDVQAGVLDARSDLFSLGVILWECLTGKRLFAAESTAKTIDAVRSRYVEPPSILQASVPPGLDEVALRLLGREPRRRYQSADELVAALDTVLADIGGQVSVRALGDWMEGLFGRERAELKRQIAKGVAVEAGLARLRLLGAVTADERHQDRHHELDGRRQEAGSESAPAAPGRDSKSMAAVRPSGQRPVVAPGPQPPQMQPQAQHPAPSSETSQTSPRLAPLRLRPGTTQPGFADAGDAPTPMVTTLPAPAGRGTPAGTVALPPPSISGRGTPGGTVALSGRGTPGGTVALPPPSPSISGPPVLTGTGTLAGPPRGRRFSAPLIAVAILAVGGIVAAVILLGGDSGPSEGTNVATGVLDIQSTPSGARVLLDGDPSGLTTPAHVTGLRAGRRIDVQVDKPGYKPAHQSAEIAAGSTRTVILPLEEALGTVRLQGVPARGTVFVDDQQIDAAGAFPLPLGAHRVRVEMGGRLFSSMKVDIQKGEQTVRIRPLEESGQ